MKNATLNLAAAALFGATALALSTASASAEIACNGEGECWHVHGHYDWKPEFGVTVHPDGWTWGATDHYTWREHRGRGYWKNGVWIKF
ncbi:MAG: hypothetical protein ABSD74_01315 [Rhizomicrobium sp.]|jgi:hypothetical protein